MTTPNISKQYIELYSQTVAARNALKLDVNVGQESLAQADIQFTLASKAQVNIHLAETKAEKERALFDALRMTMNHLVLIGISRFFELPVRHPALHAVYVQQLTLINDLNLSDKIVGAIAELNRADLLKICPDETTKDASIRYYRSEGYEVIVDDIPLGYVIKPKPGANKNLRVEWLPAARKARGKAKQTKQD